MIFKLNRLLLKKANFISRPTSFIWFVLFNREKKISIYYLVRVFIFLYENRLIRRLPIVWFRFDVCLAGLWGRWFFFKSIWFEDNNSRHDWKLQTLIKNNIFFKDGYKDRKSLSNTYIWITKRFSFFCFVFIIHTIIDFSFKWIFIHYNGMGFGFYGFAMCHRFVASSSWPILSLTVRTFTGQFYCYNLIYCNWLFKLTSSEANDIFSIGFTHKHKKTQTPERQ